MVNLELSDYLLIIVMELNCGVLLYTEISCRLRSDITVGYSNRYLQKYVHMFIPSGSLRAQTVLCGVVAPCYQHHYIDNKVPKHRSEPLD